MVDVLFVHSRGTGKESNVSVEIDFRLVMYEEEGWLFVL